MFDGSFTASVLTVFPSGVGSLKKGIVKTSNNKAKASYTVLLVGETGVGKSSALELIANVLAGNGSDHYDFNILDHASEQGGPNNQSQTKSVRLYKLMSKDGIVVSDGVCKCGEYA
jgi:energy-coupling factor transporter ATP-binding protein EcfA2